eukprot:TRINITY_DN94557_c0_g1_i1.p1 TRINITY_DN94557_c0_g1~~TRINITY_DN94557_c0_g1_i1.p1  ORF type:complete len:246 (-),score=47.99 TRINITY_DN94557_c0_g1_i1:321-968(-)
MTDLVNLLHSCTVKVNNAVEVVCDNSKLVGETVVTLVAMANHLNAHLEQAVEFSCLSKMLQTQSVNKEQNLSQLLVSRLVQQGEAAAVLVECNKIQVLVSPAIAALQCLAASLHGSEKDAKPTTSILEEAETALHSFIASHRTSEHPTIKELCNQLDEQLKDQSASKVQLQANLRRLDKWSGTKTSWMDTLLHINPFVCKLHSETNKALTNPQSC